MYLCIEDKLKKMLDNNPESEDLPLTDEMKQSLQRFVHKKVHKGLNREQNGHIGIDEYLNAVLYKEVAGGVNRGIMTRDGVLRLYKCIRQVISFFYAKRQVLDDNVSTIPLRR
jgi:hypothetical protein